jgi:hypothetical protein
VRENLEYDLVGAKDMAQIRGTNGDNPMLIGTAGDTYLGGGGDDSYILDNSFVQSGETININDDLGSNTIRLTDGLQIAGSQVLSDQMQLTLSNGTNVFVQDADAFNFDVGGTVASANSTSQNFNDFVSDTLETTVPADGESASSGGAVAVGGGTAGNITVSASNTGPFPAGNDDRTFEFESGSYTATIENFDSGDQIVEPDVGLTVQPDGSNQSDGVQEFTISDQGGTATIRLTGLTDQQDENLFKAPQFDTVFGADTLI